MEGSFYAVLGVDADADDATVRSAYRAAVKEHHPDVSDDPDARERFKRLTSARDVLLDPGERARYDRLGHDDYVSRHGRGSESSGSAGGRRRSSSGRSATGRQGGQRSDAGGASAGPDGRSRAADRAAWFQSEGGTAPNGGPSADPTQGSRAHRRATGRRHHVGTSHESTGQGGTADGYGPEDWGMASDAYRRSAAASRAAAARSRPLSLGEFLASFGPWLVVYAVFVASAIATAAFTLSQAGVGLSLVSFVFGLFLVGLVVALSSFHLASRVALSEGG